MNFQIKLNFEGCKFFTTVTIESVQIQKETGWNFYKNSRSVIKRQSGLFQKELTKTAKSLSHDPAEIQSGHLPATSQYFHRRTTFRSNYDYVKQDVYGFLGCNSFQFGISTRPHGHTALKIVLFMRNSSPACVNTNSNVLKTKEFVRKQVK
jgi:hypothetical protein